MGLNFRKSLKIAPGIKVNITKKGISSLSIGKNGARVNFGRKGVKTTAGIPGTGLSYTTQKPFKQSRKVNNTSNPALSTGPSTKVERKFLTTILLWLGIILMPYFFVWFTLQRKYTITEKVVAFSWLLLFVLIMMSK